MNTVRIRVWNTLFALDIEWLWHCNNKYKKDR